MLCCLISSTVKMMVVPFFLKWLIFRIPVIGRQKQRAKYQHNRSKFSQIKFSDNYRLKLKYNNIRVVVTISRLGSPSLIINILLLKSKRSIHSNRAVSILGVVTLWQLLSTAQVVIFEGMNFFMFLKAKTILQVYIFGAYS